MVHHPRREEHRERPEVHVAGICIRWRDQEVEILIARRAEDRELYPGLWEGCGGQLRKGESFPEGVRRHFQDEMGLKVNVLSRLHSFYEIDTGSLKIPGVRFLCEFEEGSAWSPNHSAIRWAEFDEFLRMPRREFPPQFKQGVLELLSVYFRDRLPKKTTMGDG